jgi:hypothetical protein
MHKLTFLPFLIVTLGLVKPAAANETVTLANERVTGAAYADSREQAIASARQGAAPRDDRPEPLRSALV